MPRLVHEVEGGVPVELTRRGRPVAVLVSVETYHNLLKAKPDLWASIEEFRANHDLEALAIEEVYRDVRDRSPGRDVDLG